MMRNDYRRALILLRGNAPGYSGHVRLERRTLMGSMYFQIQAPAQCPVLRASLVGSSRDSYFACDLGELNHDSRGQAVLAYNFDPRNVCGHELEDYQLIVLSCASDENCEILLCGNVCGHAQLNWERVRTAVCGLYADGIARSSNNATGRQQSEDKAMEICETEEDIRIEIHEEPADEIPADQAILNDGEHNAAELLELDIDIPWPGDAEVLRPLFIYSPPLENPPDDDYVYIASPMPDESGYPYVAVGIRVENGEPVSLRYALPSCWTAEPPAGLEEYTWV
jgi:hypothetical protein